MKLEDIVTKLKSLVDKNTSDIATQTGRINNLKAIEARQLQVDALSSQSASTPINAEVPDGYVFLCWNSVSSANFIGSPYIEWPLSQSTRIFDLNGSPGGIHKYTCTYLIAKTV